MLFFILKESLYLTEKQLFCLTNEQKKAMLLSQTEKYTSRIRLT